MRIRYQRSFIEQFAKLSKILKLQVKETIELFAEDPDDDGLRNHPLKDKWANYRSITADDDLRLHYRVIDKDTSLFVTVGPHNQLYK